MVLSSEFYISWTKGTVLKLALPNHPFICLFNKHSPNTHGILQPCTRCWDTEIILFLHFVYQKKNPQKTPKINKYHSQINTKIKNCFYYEHQPCLLTCILSIKTNYCSCPSANKNTNEFMFLNCKKYQVAPFHLNLDLTVLGCLASINAEMQHVNCS